MPTIGLFIAVLSLLFSVQALGSVLSQDLLDSFQTLFGNVVEGSAALADVVALQGNGSLDDGVGVAVLEGLLQDGDRVLSGLCALEVASLEAVVDLCNSGRPDVGAACNAACAALFQAGQDRAVVAGEDGHILVQLTVLFNADRSKLEIYPAEKEEKDYQIPEGCTEIGRYAFRDGKNLKSIDLTGVVSLEEGAFYGASLSGKLILPDSLTKLEGGFLFENCTELTSVDFGKGLEETSYRMFENCTAIKQVNAGNHLKKIAARTFTGCDALTEVKLPQSITWADEHTLPKTVYSRQMRTQHHVWNF